MFLYCHHVSHIFLLYILLYENETEYKTKSSISSKQHKKREEKGCSPRPYNKTMSIHGLGSKSLSCHATKWFGIKALPCQLQPCERELSVTVLFEEWGGGWWLRW